MKFRCDRDALSEALQTVQRGVSSRPGIPALTGVLLDGVAEGRLTAVSDEAIELQLGDGRHVRTAVILLTDILAARLAVDLSRH